MTCDMKRRSSIDQIWKKERGREKEERKEGEKKKMMEQSATRRKSMEFPQDGKPK